MVFGSRLPLHLNSLPVIPLCSLKGRGRLRTQSCHGATHSNFVVVLILNRPSHSLWLEWTVPTTYTFLACCDLSHAQMTVSALDVSVIPCVVPGRVVALLFFYIIPAYTVNLAIYFIAVTVEGSYFVLDLNPYIPHPLLLSGPYPCWILGAIYVFGPRIGYALQISGLIYLFVDRSFGSGYCRLPPLIL